MGKNMKILFFGAGKQGQKCLKIFKDYGIVPDGILDNNKELCGKLCENVMIYMPDILEIVSFEKIIITCNSTLEIYYQLLNLGVEKKKIVTGYHNILNHLIYYAAQNADARDIKEELSDRLIRQKIIFDLQNGMVLGGVESWSYELAKDFRENGYQGMYLTTDDMPSIITDNTYTVCTLMNRNCENEKEKIVLCVQKIIENLPCTIICNFARQIFWAACIVRRLYSDRIRIIAVQHSDEELFYQSYSLWQKYIDRCMVISSSIEQKLLSFGMEQKRIRRLEWSVPCKNKISKNRKKENACLQIGYAGRITIIAKRIDLLLPLVKKLKKRKIQFQINIAGTGDYSNILKHKIQEENLQVYMVLLGCIDRKSIPDFWKKQDIMISCSEWEGHSISQSEAMAEGAVPVITDVSGARDDVTDGYNGFVVPVGNLDALADRICYLYHNRSELERMGRCAHDTIYERQKDMNQAEFWDKLLKEVWKS